MAKNGLGRGLGALLSENSAAAEEVAIATGATSLSSTSSEKTQVPELTLPSHITTDEQGGLWINPELLKPNPKQPRKEFDPQKLQELSDSIKENGVLEPIVIQYDKKLDAFYIIAGERRTRASKMAGLTKVPVVLREYTDQQKLEMALIENIQRADLNPIEEATAYYNLIQMGANQEEVAKKVGKNRSTVANAVRLLKLPEDIQRSLVSGQISSGHARALLMVKSDADMHVLFGKIIGNGLSVREAETLAEEYNNGGRAAQKKTTKRTTTKDPDIAIFEQDLRNIFGVRDVNFKGTMDKGSIEIGFSSQKDFDRIYKILTKKR